MKFLEVEEDRLQTTK